MVESVEAAFPELAITFCEFGNFLQRRGGEATGSTLRIAPALDEPGAPLKEVAEFTEGYRKFWERSFDRLDHYLQKLQSKGRKNVRKTSKR